MLKQIAALASCAKSTSHHAWSSRARHLRLAHAVWLTALGLAATAAEPYRGDWVRVTEHAPFAPRDTSEGVVFAGKMWLSNGWLRGEKLEKDLWTSTDGVQWSLVSTNTPYDGYAEMAVYRGKLWAMQGSMWNSADGVHWNQVLPRTPFGARGYGELLVHKGRLWQLGSGEDVWNSRDGMHWNCVTNISGYGRRFAAAAVSYKKKLWVMGGAIERTNTPPEKLYHKFTTFNDVWCSADGARWTRVTEHAPWGPRMWFIPIVYADRLWIVGGFDNVHRANFDDVWWTEDGLAWRRLETKSKFSPRHEATLYDYKGSLWVVAGNSWPLMNDVWKLTPRPGRGALRVED
jgi:hypothetical protein